MSEVAAIKPDRFLRLSDVCERSGLKKTQLYDLMNAGQFPRSIRLGMRTTAWSERAIETWMQERVQASLASRGRVHG